MYPCNLFMSKNIVKSCIKKERFMHIYIEADISVEKNEKGHTLIKT